MFSVKEKICTFAFGSAFILTQLTQAINSPSVPTAVEKCKISIEKNKEKNRKIDFSALFYALFQRLMASFSISRKV